MRITERLAHFITRTGYENLSEHSVLEAKKCFADGIEVMVANAFDTGGALEAEFVRRLCRF